MNGFLNTDDDDDDDDCMWQNLLAICAVVLRNQQAAYLTEWLAYHALAGVDLVVLYENNSTTDDWRSATAPFEKQGFAKVVYLPKADNVVGDFQIAAYGHCINHTQASVAALIEVDEFLAPAQLGGAARAVRCSSFDVELGLPRFVVVAPWRSSHYLDAERVCAGAHAKLRKHAVRLGLADSDKRRRARKRPGVRGSTNRRRPPVFYRTVSGPHVLHLATRSRAEGLERSTVNSDGARRDYDEKYVNKNACLYPEAYVTTKEKAAKDRDVFFAEPRLLEGSALERKIRAYQRDRSSPLRRDGLFDARLRAGFRLRSTSESEESEEGGRAAWSARCFAPGRVPIRRPPRGVLGYCAPSFLIIGFGRCGTTSLSKYLEKHPRITFGTRKEHFYFYRPEFCDLQHGPNERASCDLEAYASQFPVRVPGKNFTFDATPMLGGDMGVPASERTMSWLRTRLPRLKLVVLVKSPADRFMSNPLATAKITRLQESLKSGENQMPHKLNQLLMDNCYVDKLNAWLRFFPSTRFYLIRSEDLRGPLPQRQRILDHLHDFLGVEPHAYAPDDLMVEENVRRATNLSLLPVARAVINCLPRLRNCEARLEKAVDAEDTVFGWCDAARVSEMPVLRSSRPPVPKPATTPAPEPAITTPPLVLLTRLLRLPTTTTTTTGGASCANSPCDFRVLGAGPLADLLARHPDLRRTNGRLELDDDVTAVSPPERVVVVLAPPSTQLLLGGLASPLELARLEAAVKRGGRPRRFRAALRSTCLVDRIAPWWRDGGAADRVIFVRGDAMVRDPARALDALHAALRLRAHTYGPHDLSGIRGNLTSVFSPEVREAIDCYPSNLACELRLGSALDPPRALAWCDEAARLAPKKRGKTTKKKKKKKKRSFFALSS
ncbi:hypothetical protein CTAYLR_005827 [Chrysophaeum taylorii]|uniref:Sulfotransferase domain-containing protein n=1 Tax=Chrysophaeum taylorii TaxID=2483200 RepID=A0AAD7XNI0_9STRA|nr:hypothetical protein CTAYLR_005827 [Chrysophaeum taylorii]